MRHVCVSVLDKKSGLFGAPMTVPAAGVAGRWFSDEVNRKAEDNLYNVHPEDFGLYGVGFFDAETGRFEVSDDPSGGPVLLLEGVAAKRE